MFIDLDSHKKNEQITVCMNGHSKTFKNAKITVEKSLKVKNENIYPNSAKNEENMFQFTICGDEIEINY